MGDRFRNRAIVGVLLAVAAAAAVGMFAYNAGVAQGLAESARWAATPGAPPPYPYMWRPWGFGFGFFPILLLLFFFFGLRRLLGGGRGWGYGHYGDGVPPRFEEWHRRAHDRDAIPRSTPGTTA
jgi:hypothetical protein